MTEANTVVNSVASAVTSSAKRKECPKCATARKSGKLSCCARGGAWFKKCGDVGDANFEYTWTEGFRACNIGFMGEPWFGIEAASQVNGERIILEPNTTELQKYNQERNDIYPNNDMSASRATDGENHIDSAKATVFTSLLVVACACCCNLFFYYKVN